MNKRSPAINARWKTSDSADLFLLPRQVSLRDRMESRGSLLLRLRVTTVGMENFYLKFNSERDKAAFLLSLYHSGTKLPFFFFSRPEKAMARRDRHKFMDFSWNRARNALLAFWCFDGFARERGMLRRSLGSAAFRLKVSPLPSETTNLEQLPLSPRSREMKFIPEKPKPSQRGLMKINWKSKPIISNFRWKRVHSAPAHVRAKLLLPDWVWLFGALKHFVSAFSWLSFN